MPVLQDKPNGECIFLEGNDCAVQAVKPKQCRDFPNLWNLPGFEKTCRAVPKIVSASEYQQLLTGAAKAGHEQRGEIQPSRSPDLR